MPRTGPNSIRKRSINVAIHSDKQADVTSHRRRKVDSPKFCQGVGVPEQRVADCDMEGEVRHCDTVRHTRVATQLIHRRDGVLNRWPTRNARPTNQMGLV
jgi:hypothetical protein